ncbi:MAG TPA: glycosyltransferase family 2 protein [Methanobacterium sp.]|nr:glycosyltransferase family 2 protein [Methanobacterium sp.]
MPLVSVLMTSYNHERFIQEAIESVLAQTCSDLELIVVDDASKDGSREIIKELQRKDKRIKPVFHASNKGIARTINDGIENSSGKYLALIASDDLWREDKLEKQLEILEKNENRVVWCNAEIIDGESHPTCKTSSEIFKNSELNGFVFEDLPSAWLCGSSIMLKRDNLKGISFNEEMKYLNDTQFYMDIGYKYEYHYMEETLAKYRLHSNNTSSRDVKGWYNDSLLLCKYFLQEYSDETSYRALKNIFHKTCIISFIACKNVDFWNKWNFIYPEIIFSVFMTLAIRNVLLVSIKHASNKIKSINTS